MAKKKGTVSKAGKSKFSYFVQLDGDDFYYNTKFKPKCGEGDVVGIEYARQNDQRGQIKNLKVLEDNSGGYDSSNSEKSYDTPSTSKRSGGGGGDRQNSIIWQSCQKVASVLLQAEVAAGAVASKGNPDSKAAEIKGRFDELTVSLFEDASDPKNSQTYKDVKGIESDASNDDTESDDDEWDDGDDDWD
jgi:hypothetical protein